jgi:DNA-binding NarL/FixJ family response regulator
VDLRVVVADDNFLVREGVAAMLDEIDGMEVVGAVADAEALLDAVARLSPDVVLTDIRMPPTFTTEGLQAAHRIRALSPRTGVVVLSSFVEEEWGLALVAQGAAGLGYLLKDHLADMDELVHAVRTVARGGASMDPRVIEGLLVRRDTDVDPPLPDLTEREHQVLAQMATGRSNAAIARKLHLSERSVEKAISTTFVKLGLSEETETNRRVAAVLAYLDAGATRAGPGR